MTGKVILERAVPQPGGGAFFVRAGRVGLRGAGGAGKHPTMTRARSFLASLDPMHALRVALKVMGRALSRLWGRDVMLYVGGVSFFALLAVFPGIALAIGLYGVFLSPERAAPMSSSGLWN